MLKGLYAISDEVLTPDAKLLEKAEAALKGGAKLFQLRHKSASDAALLPIARELKTLCETHNALLIVNDRVELALKSKAHGLHLGQDDGDLRAARDRLGGGVMIGLSCYGDLGRAEIMQKAGADYVAFGSFFVSPTKPAAPVVPLSVLGEAKKRLSVPLCAIGGITLQNAPELIAAGADMIAVISDLWRAQEITGHGRAFSRLYLKENL